MNASDRGPDLDRAATVVLVAGPVRSACPARPGQLTVASPVPLTAVLLTAVLLTAVLATAVPPAAVPPAAVPPAAVPRPRCC